MFLWWIWLAIGLAVIFVAVGSGAVRRRRAAAGPSARETGGGYRVREVGGLDFRRGPEAR